MALDSAPAQIPHITRLEGFRVTLVPLDAATHAQRLYEEVDGHPELWNYLFEEAPANLAAFRMMLQSKQGKNDPYFLTIVDNGTERPLGIASYMRIEPQHKVVEVGSILLCPRLQRTPHATEAMYLMARHAFEDLGYRRYEWKCNTLNAPSRRAALRLGFTCEGIFKQHMIVKGESRDTAWFSMLDYEWPSRKKAFEQWLATDNFQADGTQKRTLASFREPD